MAIANTVNIALETNETKIAEVDAKLDAFIAAHPDTPPVDNSGDNQAIVDRLTAQAQSLDKIAAKLK